MPRVIFRPSPRRPPTRREPVTVHLRQPPADAIVERHSHAWGQLACPIAGSLRLAAAGMTWCVSTHRAIWTPPGIAHELIMLGRVEFNVIYVEPKAAPLSLARCGIVHLSPLSAALVSALADYAPTYRAPAYHAPPNDRRRQLMIRLLLAEMRSTSRRAPEPGLPLPGDRRLRALCDRLLDEPGSPLPLGDWAPIVGASERTLARLFASELRTTFARWRQHVRLARALDMIASRTPLAVVADAVGYQSAGAFSTMFKRALGVAPSRYAVDGVAARTPTRAISLTRDADRRTIKGTAERHRR